jgi:hypothetical protein
MKKNNIWKCTMIFYRHNGQSNMHILLVIKLKALRQGVKAIYRYTILIMKWKSIIFAIAHNINIFELYNQSGMTFCMEGEDINLKRRGEVLRTHTVERYWKEQRRWNMALYSCSLWLYSWCHPSCHVDG